MQIASDEVFLDLQLGAAVALGEFTDLPAVLPLLGSLALDVTLPIDLRLPGVHIARTRRANHGMRRASAATLDRRDARPFRPECAVRLAPGMRSPLGAVAGVLPSRRPEPLSGQPGQRWHHGGGASAARVAAVCG